MAFQAALEFSVEVAMHLKSSVSHELRKFTGK